MADIVRDQQTTLPVTMLTRYRDMGDGTHAEVISVPGPFNVTVTGGTIIVQGVAGGTPVNVAQTGAPWAAYITDSAGTANGVIDNKLRVSSMPYSYDISEGNVSGHNSWTKIGYCPIGATTDTDIWSYGGTVPVVPLISTGATLKVRTNNAADAGTSIFSGNSSGGSTTSLVDATKDFTGGTPVAAGDCVLLDPAGTTPEWGFVTAIPNATTLTVAGDFSSGGTGSGRTYSVIDYSNQAGCHAVLLNGLAPTTWATQREIVVTGGAGPADVTTSKTWQRINSFRVIAAGANSRPTGYVALMDSGAIPATTYSYITATYTRARNSHYTVPAGRVLYVNELNLSYVGSAANQNCRIYTRASQYSFESGGTPFLTRVSNGVNVWYPYSEVILSTGTVSIQLPQPTRILPTADLKISAYASGAGAVSIAMRGWLEDV